MAMGFLFSYDCLVEVKLDKFYTGFKDDASEAGQKKWEDSVNDILGGAEKEGLHDEQIFPI